MDLRACSDGAQIPELFGASATANGRQHGSTTKARNVADEADKARRRRLHDELRVHGRGGIVTVSTAIVAAGEMAAVYILRAVANHHGLVNTEGDRGSLETSYGPVEWAIFSTSEKSRVLAVWILAEAPTVSRETSHGA